MESDTYVSRQMLMCSLAQLSSDPTLLQQMASSKCPAHLKSSRRALSLQFAMEKGTCVSDRLELGMMAFTLVQNGTLVKELIAMLFNSQCIYIYHIGLLWARKNA